MNANTRFFRLQWCGKSAIIMKCRKKPMICRGLAQFGSALGLGPRGRGFKSLNPDQFKCICAGVAQLVEQLICNQQVAGSSPIASSIFLILRKSSRVAKGGRL